MDGVLPKEIQAELDAARLEGAQNASRLGLVTDGKRYPLARLWKTGFSVIASDLPPLRGCVNVFDGPDHLFQCLIVATAHEAGEMHYTFKRATVVAHAPPVDFVKSLHAPVALIANGRSVSS